MFNKNDYEILVKEAVRDISKLGCSELLDNRYITKVVDTDKRVNAQIQRIGATNSYFITVNSKLNKCEYNEVKTTIYHEVLHSIKNGFSHTGKWLEKAKEVNKLYGLDIKRANGFDAVNKQFKIQLQCSNCGKTYGYSRMSKTVKDNVLHPLNYGCGACGQWGTLKLIKKK